MSDGRFSVQIKKEIKSEKRILFSPSTTVGGAVGGRGGSLLLGVVSLKK